MLHHQTEIFLIIPVPWCFKMPKERKFFHEEKTAESFFFPFEFAIFPWHLSTAYPLHQHCTSPHIKKTPGSMLCSLTNNCGGARMALSCLCAGRPAAAHIAISQWTSLCCSLFLSRDTPLGLILLSRHSFSLNVQELHVSNLFMPFSKVAEMVQKF